MISVRHEPTMLFNEVSIKPLIFYNDSDVGLDSVERIKDAFESYMKVFSFDACRLD